jgi:hypothetical protein
MSNGILASFARASEEQQPAASRLLAGSFRLAVICKQMLNERQLPSLNLT